jgi:hypothetical protein
LSESSRSARRGQSFVGLLSVLLVLTVLTAFAAPRVDLTRFRSDAIARQAASVFTNAKRTARLRRHDVVVRLDSAGKRLAVIEDSNGNGRRDPGEPETLYDLDANADLRDPPTPLPTVPSTLARRSVGMGYVSAPVAVGSMTFRRSGTSNADFVLYLTSDAAVPGAWRAVHVAARSGAVQLWRFDGVRWSRGRT